MSESILDRLDREHGDARQYVATLFVVGGATREQVAEALARKYDIPAPTGRSVSKWKNGDPELRDLIRQMEAAKRDLTPDDDPTALLRPEVNTAQAAADLFGVALQSPSFAALLKREAERRGGAYAAGLYFDEFAPDPDGDDDQEADDVLAVLRAGHDTAAEFEADCLARLAADPLPTP